MSDLGTVEFTCFGQTVRATLRSDRTWDVQCDDAEAKEFAETVAAEIATRRHGPEHGFYGPRQLRLLAEAFGGKIVREVQREGDPETIY